MLTVNLNAVPLTHFWAENQPTQRASATFPLLGGQENEQTSVVYFELEPGYELGLHTDSAEEILLILEGRVEVTVGDETGVVEGPALAVVPTMLPHNLRNVGEVQAKVAGFFPVRFIVATFENTWLPNQSNVVDTEQLLASLSQ